MHPIRLTSAAIFLAGALLAASGCSTPKPEPEIASSAAQSGYAERWPNELQGAAEGFSTNESTAKTTSGELSGYPDQLKNPNWGQVLEVVEEADAAGRSYDYVERRRTVDGAAAFFEENKEEITKKVAGAAQYAAKQKGCDVDVAGPVAHALKESVDKELERHLRDRSEAHRRIDRYRDALGKENAEKLEKQADAISNASYIVHIDLVERKVRLQRVMEELETVQKSIDGAIESERAFQSEPKRTDEEKKAAEARIESLNKAKASLESAVTQAKSVQEGMEERVKQAQQQYKEAFDKLDATLRERGNLPARPPPPEE